MTPTGVRPERLAGATVVVTGGSVGIGHAIAARCAAEGAAVVIVARDRRNLDQALDALRAASERPHRCYPLDVGEPGAVAEFGRWLLDEGLQPTGLVNCAGINGPIGKTTEVDMRAFGDTLRVNLLGSVSMCHALRPFLERRSLRKIVNCGGGGSTFPFPNYSAYAVTKVALVRLTENLALELAPDGCEVNCIAPGFVLTRLHEQTLAAGPDKVGQAHFDKVQRELAKGGVPAGKSAELTTFLLSAESDGITGKYLSAAWDPWQDPAFQERLRNDQDFATLRRIDDHSYFGRRNG
jgi:3-oxoacyl-[acyl-carrier protein] reductase